MLDDGPKLVHRYVQEGRSLKTRSPLGERSRSPIGECYYLFTCCDILKANVINCYLFLSKNKFTLIQLVFELSFE